MLDLFNLDGKYAIITGSTGLLGQKHCEAIMKAGGTPILTDIDDERLALLSLALERQFGRIVPWYSMDVTNESSISGVQHSLSEKGIFASILINNAALNPKVSGEKLQTSGRLEAFDAENFISEAKVGLIGATLCAKIFGQAMARNCEGSIINIASDLGVIAPDQRLYRQEGLPEGEQNVKPVSYSLIKHGIIGLTKYLATYWAEKNVRCNSISPGGVSNGQGEEFTRRISELIPMKRMARVDEIQGAIIFLASRASSYMNGSNLIIDGGRSTW